MINENEMRARVRQMLHKRTEIKPEEIPDGIRSMVRDELDLWRPATQLAGIDHWHWQPALNDGEPKIIAQQFDWLVLHVADELVKRFDCTRGMAVDAARQLIESEAGGPLRPPGGVRKFLETWAAGDK
jgi:hypothetical protein